jgi:F-type H+-transporting ATPase subunit c
VFLASMNNLLLPAKAIGAGISTIALLGVGIGVGTIFSSLMSAIAKNPFQEKQLFTYAMLGFAVTEATGLFALLITFLILFTV